MASLTLRGIQKAFGGVEVLSDVEFEVEDGEFCVLLGPSGCGKSTLLNIIAGLIPQDEGTILLNNEAIDRLSPRERDVAMVFQNYALYPHMTVADNLGFGLKMRKVPKDQIRDRVEETAKLLRIENLLDRKPKELSGGQQQRVAMGRALVRRPRLFLLDEPLSNLDARLRSGVRVELKQLHRRVKGTIIYVTHDQVEAMTLGDKVVVLREGKVNQIGPPAAIYEEPANTFVATFIGSPEMNIYQGSIRSHEDRLTFEGAGFSLDIEKMDPGIGHGEAELGFRPEDARIGKSEAIVFEVQVEMLSNIGSEKIIHARLGRESMTIKAPKEAAFGADQTISVSIDPRRLHLFRGGERVQVTNPQRP